MNTLSLPRQILSASQIEDIRLAAIPGLLKTII